MIEILTVLAHDQPVPHWRLGDVIIYIPVVLAVALGIAAFAFRRPLRRWLARRAR